MAEASDVRELVDDADAADAADADFFPLNDLPNDVLVSVFAAVEDPTWVRHTFPLVCRAWNELYRTKDASPLHETLEVDFGKEVDGVPREWEDEEDEERDLPVVHASRVISWAQAQERAGSVRKLDLKRGEVRDGSFRDFSSEELGALVAVVGSSLTGISIGFDIRVLLKRPFWESLRDSVVPAGRLRSFVVENIDSTLLESDVEPLGQLAGSLEELELKTLYCEKPFEKGLPRFPESLFALKELRRLALTGHPRITAIPAGILSLKKLKELKVAICDLSSLPKELGELSRLTKLDVGGNRNLGTTAEAFPAELGKMKPLRVLRLSDCGLRTVPSFVGELKSLESLTLQRNNDLSSLPKELGELSGLTSLTLGGNWNLGTALPANEAFPAELGKMKSLRDLSLMGCGLRTVPSFVGELKSLEVLHLEYNSSLQIDAPLDFLIEGCPRLREVRLGKWHGRDPWNPRSLANLEAFKAKLRAKNPDAKVHTSHTC